jgi:hypothetical protein
VKILNFSPQQESSKCSALTGISSEYEPVIACYIYIINVVYKKSETEKAGVKGSWMSVDQIELY